MPGRLHAAFVVAALLSPHTLAAQQLTLAVQDQSGGAIAGAAVTITTTQQASVAAPIAAANHDGAVMLTLSPGTYTLHVVSRGFRAAETQVTVPPYSATPIRVTLKAAEQIDDCTVSIVVPEPIPLIPSHLSAMLPEPHRAGRRHPRRVHIPKLDPNDLDPLSRI